MTIDLQAACTNKLGTASYNLKASDSQKPQRAAMAVEAAALTQTDGVDVCVIWPWGEPQECTDTDPCISRSFFYNDDVQKRVSPAVRTFCPLTAAEVIKLMEAYVAKGKLPELSPWDGIPRDCYWINTFATIVARMGIQA